MLKKLFVSLLVGFVAFGTLFSNFNSTYASETNELEKEGITIDFSVYALTEKEQEMVENYQSGEINKKGYKAIRKAKAEETGLTKYCDENYFMNDAFYEKYDAKMLTFDGCSILDKTITKEYQDNIESYLNRKSKLNRFSTRASLNVTNVQQVRCDVPNSLYLQNELFSLSNGNIAFCAENREATPQTGMVARTSYELDRADLRKIIYYGYGGPGNILGQYGAGAACITSEAFSYLFSGTSVCLLGSAYTERFDNFIRPKMNEMLSKPDPIQYGFKIYMVEFDGMNTSWMGEWRPYQKLVYGEIATGKIKALKTSSNLEMTSGNSAYSLSGAQYGVYSDTSATQLVGTLTTTVDGTSNELELNQGDYYIKETKSPTGYALDTTIHKVTVVSGETNEFQVSETPQYVPPEKRMYKKDADTGDTPQGDATFAGAEFTVKFYKGDNASNSDPAQSGKTADRTWVLKADSTGYIALDDAHKVSGDAFYTGTDGTPGFPLGTVTVQETKAPVGYNLNKEVFVRVIDANGTTETVDTFKTLLIQDSVIEGKVKVTKKDKESGKTVKLAGFVFDVYFHDGTLVDTITTDANGAATSKDLPYGQYYIKERKAANPYTVDTGTQTSFSITNEGDIISLTFSDTRVKGEATIWKLDSYYNDRTTQGEGILEGAKYGLYAKSDILDPADGSVIYKAGTQITEVTINDAPVTVDELYLGEYYWKETQAPTGYKVDTTQHNFTLAYKDENTPIVTNSLTVQEDIIDGKFMIHKGITDGDYTEIITPEVGGEFITVLKKYVDQYGSIEEAYQHKDEFADSEWDHLVTDKNGNATTKALAYGTYVVKQIKAPEEVNMLKETFEFVVSQENQEMKQYSINNTPMEYYIRIQKQDSKTGEMVSYSPTSFKIKDEEGNYVSMKVGSKTYDTFTTASGSDEGIPEGAFVVETGDPGTIQTPLTLKAGTYTLEEVQVPKGYLELDQPITFEVKAKNVTEVDKEGNNVVTITAEDDKPTGEIVLYKSFENYNLPVPNSADDTLDINEGDVVFQLTANSNIVNPATGAILYKKGDVVNVNGASNGEYFVNEIGTLRISDLPMSDGEVSYCLQEIKTIDGFVLDTQKYIFNFAQTDTVTTEYRQEKSIENKITKFEISKQDVAGEEVPGAELEITDEAGNVIDSWTSTDTPHYIEGLVVGKTYTLHEKVAADGYTLAQSISFTVENTESIQKVEMVDKKLNVEKQDAKSSLLTGAKLQIKDETQTVVESWTTEYETHSTTNLEVGKSYTLEEVEAPEGYVRNLPTTFTIQDDKKDQTIRMIDKQIFFEKKDTKQKFVSGATIEVTDVDGNIVDTWTTGSDYHAISGLVVGQTYTITETKTPDGYVTAEPITFTVSTNNQSEIISMIDTQVYFNKLNTKGNGVEGAKMEISEKDTNTVISTWMTNGNSTAIQGLKENATYVLKELEAPNGYVRANPIEITTKEEDAEYTMTDVVETVKKVDQFGRLVSGAKLQVTSPDGSLVYDEWVSGQQIVELTDAQKEELKTKGTITYTGPLMTTPYTLTSEEEEKVEKVQESKSQNLFERLGTLLIDALTKDDVTDENTDEIPEPDKDYTITVRKVDANSQQEQSSEEEQQKEEMREQSLVDTEYVAGYEVKAVDEDNNYFYFNIDENGNETTHRVSNLDANTDYVLKEVEAPANHTVSPDIPFTTLDNADQTVEMKDIKVDSVTISKKDLTTQEELPGAKLKVTDGNDNVVDEWTSTEEEHQIDGLVVGETYTLTEVAAPEYYNEAVSIDFVVEDNDAEMQHIDMLDERKVNTVEISKKDASTKEELPGAQLKVTDKDGNVIDQWTSTTEPHIIKDLRVGEEYTLTEVLAPQYYDKAESITFVIEEAGDVYQKIEMFDEHRLDDVSITKKDASNKKELPGAKLEVKDKDGKVVDAWTSTDEEHIVENLLVGETYTLTETRAPDGYKIAESITFVVQDNGEVKQKITMYDEEKPKTNTGIGSSNSTSMFGLALGSLLLAGIVLLGIAHRRKSE